MNGELLLRVDGTLAPSADALAAVSEVCDRAEDLRGADVRVLIEVSGAPASGWAAGLAVGLVSKWERALRRLERLPAALVAVADGDCGGTALDAFLVADHRIAKPEARLLPTAADGTVWPGMALYRIGRSAAQALAVRRAVLLGAPLSAAQAAALSLVHEVSADPVSAVAEFAAAARGVNGAELAVRRQLLFDASTTGFEEALGAHLAACDRLLRRASAGAQA